MVKIRQPTVVAVVLSSATLLLVGATVVAASLPSPSEAQVSVSRTETPDASPSTTTKPSPQRTDSVDPAPSAETPTVEPTTPAAKEPAPSKTETATYTVKRGDTLSDIAAWFKEHGYQDLYEKNKAVIGSDPDLIFPGQKITISESGTEMSEQD